jgi:hypothetical protein
MPADTEVTRIAKKAITLTPTKATPRKKSTT